MVFSVTFAETIAVFLDSITQFMYNFLPGFFIFMSVITVFVIFYRIFVRGKEIVEKADQVHDSLSALRNLLFFIQPEEILDSYDTAKAIQLMEQLKNSGCYICPTLSLWNGQLKVINSELIQNENSKYVPAQYLNGWSTFASVGFTAHILPSEYDLFKRFINKRFELVNELNQYGISFLDKFFHKDILSDKRFCWHLLWKVI